MVQNYIRNFKYFNSIFYENLEKLLGNKNNKRLNFVKDTKNERLKIWRSHKNFRYCSF